MNHLYILTLALAGILTMSSSSAAPENLASGKSYTFSPAPNYPLCSPAGDETDLTDGRLSGEGYWTDEATVGWQHPGGPITITMDLGEVLPVSGVTVRSSGGGAGVSLPRSIAVLGSTDGESYHYLCDLVGDDMSPPPPGFLHDQTHRFRVDDLSSRVRYLRFVVVPVNIFFFTDEIEVLRGPAEATAVSGPSLTMEELTDRQRLTWLGVHQRLRMDLYEVMEAVEAADLSPAERQGFTGRLTACQRSLAELRPADIDLDTFRAVIPLNETHAAILAERGRLLALTGSPTVIAWPGEPYMPLELFAEPAGTLDELRVTALPGERRAAVFNLTNASAEPRTLRVSMAGEAASLVTLRQGVYVDSREHVAWASALPEVDLQDGVGTIELPAGMTRQLWLQVEVPVSAADGQHNARIELSSGDWQQTVPLQVEVVDLDLPQEQQLQMSTWDYATTHHYQLRPSLEEAAMNHLLASGVTTGWLGPSAQPAVTPDDFDAEGKLVGEVDYTAWDRASAPWREAEHVVLFMAVNHLKGFAGMARGTAAFDRALADYGQNWTAHLGEQGFRPGQVMVMFLDEPGTTEHYQAAGDWGRAFAAGTDDILLFSTTNAGFINDPVGREGHLPYHILSPTTNHLMHLPEEQRQALLRYVEEHDKKLWLYMCSGPALTFDPSYFRLQAWHCLDVGATGSSFWAYGDAGRGDPWNGYWAIAATSYTPVYFDDTTITPSRHWEAYREGAQDYQLMLALQQRLAEAGDRLPAATRTKAEGLVRDMLADVIEAYGDYYYTQSSGASRYADAARATAITILREMLEEQRD